MSAGRRKENIVVLLRLLVLACASLLLLGGVAGAAGPELRGSVGPWFTVAVTDASWKVTLSAGTLVYASNAKKHLLRGGRVKVS